MEKMYSQLSGDVKINNLINNAKDAGNYKDPYDGINFIEFNPIIKDRDGNIIFNEKVVFPDYFRENDVKIVASKYLANQSKIKENDIRQMIDRVSNTITDWGIKDGYFKSYDEAIEFNYNLKYNQIHQFFSFNSPVYFNIGLSDRPTLSACFILDVEDNMDSITDWLSTEAKIFKQGSGSGINLSKLRSSIERVKAGGLASGPISFLKGTDTFASIIKSGGTFRRAAKMAILNDHHPDIFKFIRCKDKEEEKLRVIKLAGIVAETGYELSDEVYFQNTNLTTSLADKFMNAVENDEDWETTEITTGKTYEKFKARHLMMEIATHAWETGDPGIAFRDTINRWNTLPDEGDIDSSNPCGEYWSLKDTSCNLAAINLRKCFYRDKDTGKICFNKALFYNVVRTMVISQDIFIDNGSFPSDSITERTRKYRALGAGFSNLGAVFMFLGIPYGYELSTQYTSALSSLLTGTAYSISMEIAANIEPGEWWHNTKNQLSFKKVLDMHRDHLVHTDFDTNNDLLDEIVGLSKNTWDDICNNFRPARNSQTTLVAPTGTTGFLMGCDTFGPEPSFSHIIYKTLSGNDGATVKLINESVYDGLVSLGYTEYEIGIIKNELENKDIPIERSSVIKPEHFVVFDTSIPPHNGKRSIPYINHLNILCAIQPFISSAISKTINLSSDATIEDIYNIYVYAWRKGLKSITVYRNGSKTEQVIINEDKQKKLIEDIITQYKPIRTKLPKRRIGLTQDFTINGSLRGYITSNPYPKGNLGEVFVTLATDGSTISGIMDGIFTLTSIMLQYGIPLEEIVRKMIHRRFEPAGFVNDPDIRTCTSVLDYVFKRLALDYLEPDTLKELGIFSKSDSVDSDDTTNVRVKEYGSPCSICGELTVRIGTCDQCQNCGTSSGVCG